MYSIYHFYKDLINKRAHFLSIINLADFPFDSNLLSSKNKGVFPDLSIKLNADAGTAGFTGGELVELKDSKSYLVASFNSTIPTGTKALSDIVTGTNSVVGRQMERAGDNINALPLREVFYLVRGRKHGKQKIVLTHGSFFETIPKASLINQAFLQMFEERLMETGKSKLKTLLSSLTGLFSRQENFSKVRNVAKASVKLRFRIMTEAKAEGNILNSEKYPDICDNTLNFVLPYHREQDRHNALKKLRSVFTEEELAAMKELKFKHHLNGNFLVFQRQLVP